MISKQDIDLYLSQIKTDDPTLQRLLACMSKDLKNIIDEYDKAMKIIEDTKDSNVVLQRDELRRENYALKKTINELEDDRNYANKMYRETKTKLFMARKLIKASKDFKKMARMIKYYFEVYGEDF